MFKFCEELFPEYCTYAEEESKAYSSFVNSYFEGFWLGDVDMNSKDKKEFAKKINKLDNNKVSKKIKGAINAIVSRSRTFEEAVEKIGQEFPDIKHHWAGALGINEG